MSGSGFAVPASSDEVWLATEIRDPGDPRSGSTSSFVAELATTSRGPLARTSPLALSLRGSGSAGQGVFLEIAAALAPIASPPGPRREIPVSFGEQLVAAHADQRPDCVERDRAAVFRPAPPTQAWAWASLLSTSVPSMSKITAWSWPEPLSSVMNAGFLERELSEVVLADLAVRGGRVVEADTRVRARHGRLCCQSAD